VRETLLASILHNTDTEMLGSRPVLGLETLQARPHFGGLHLDLGLERSGLELGLGVGLTSDPVKPIQPPHTSSLLSYSRVAYDQICDAWII
jgi:hypothetical protein